MLKMVNVKMPSTYWCLVSCGPALWKVRWWHIQLMCEKAEKNSILSHSVLFFLWPELYQWEIFVNTRLCQDIFKQNKTKNPTKIPQKKTQKNPKWTPEKPPKNKWKNKILISVERALFSIWWLNMTNVN